MPVELPIQHDDVADDDGGDATFLHQEVTITQAATLLRQELTALVDSGTTTRPA